MELILYVRSMGKALRVVKWFPSGPDGTNEYCGKHDDVGVVADCDGLILIARLNDRGAKVQD